MSELLLEPWSLDRRVRGVEGNKRGALDRKLQALTEIYLIFCAVTRAETQLRGLKQRNRRGVKTEGILRL